MKLNYHMSPWLIKLATVILIGVLGSALLFVYGLWAIILPVIISVWIILIRLYNCYRSLKVDNYKTKYTFLYQLVSMLWYGFIGYLIVISDKFHANYFELSRIYQAGDVSTLTTLVIIAISALFGFCFGYRVLLLPPSLKGCLTVLLGGFIGFEFAALLAATYIYCVVITIGNIPVLDGFFSLMFGSVTYITIIVGVATVLYLPQVLLATLCLYLLGLIFKRITASNHAKSH